MFIYKNFYLRESAECQKYNIQVFWEGVKLDKAILDHGLKIGASSNAAQMRLKLERHF
jgi:hypothetical protein